MLSVPMFQIKEPTSFRREGDWKINIYPFYGTHVATYHFSSMCSLTSRRKKFLSRHALPTNSTQGVMCGVKVVVGRSRIIVVLGRE